MVTGCTITGGREGIVTHSVQTMLIENHVRRTQLRAISVTEMSMGMVEHNDVHDALGIGIYCGDRSMCEIEHNVVSEHAGRPRVGRPVAHRLRDRGVVGIGGGADDNVLVGNPQGAGSFSSSRIRWPR